MPEDDHASPLADGVRGLHVDLLTDRQYRSPHQSDKQGDGADPDRDDDVLESHAEDGDEGEGQEETVKGEQDVGDALDDQVCKTTLET